MSRKERLTRYWLIFLLYMVFVFVVSSMPAGDLPDFKWDLADSLIHFFEYLLFGFLCIRAVKASYPDFEPRHLFTATILFSIAFAISDEIHQSYVPGRVCETSDLISDSLGALLGLVIYEKARLREWLK